MITRILRRRNLERGLLGVSYFGTATTNCSVAYDGNGNVAALVNANDGTLTANYEYGPFGEVIRMSGLMATINPFRFSTKYQDNETDLLYYGYRFYNSSHGRWINRDPIEEPGFELIVDRVKENKKTIREERIKESLNLLQRDNFLLAERDKNKIAQLNFVSSSEVQRKINVNQNTINLFAFVGNNPIMKIDLHGLDCNYTCFRIGTLIPMYACALQNLDGCEGQCDRVILIWLPGQGHGFHIAIPFDTGCPCDRGRRKLYPGDPVPGMT